MATAKAVKLPDTIITDRTSETRMNLQYAQQVAIAVKKRRRAELQRRFDELDSLPVTQPADISLRDDLMREVQSQMKQLDDE